MLEATGSRPLPEMHQADESSFYLAIPEAPFRSFELIQRMAANRSIGQTINAFRNLLEMLKSHTNVEPIQHMLGTRRQLSMNLRAGQRRRP